jgi:hypothetical protein
MHPSCAWSSTFAAAVWEVHAPGGWRRWPASASSPLAAISAMNPGVRRLSATANRSRDAALRRHLARLGLTAIRVRGRSADGAWIEEGWLIAHRPARTRRLLADFHQLAAEILGPHGRRTCWL